jgi:hypothetical protein
MMDDDGNSLRVSAYTCNYDTWNLLSQDVPAPDLRDEGTPQYATSDTRIEFVWLHQSRPFFLNIRTITLGAKRRDSQRKNRTFSAKRFDTQIRNRTLGEKRR